MNYVLSVLIITFLVFMIFTNVKAIIEKVKQKKKQKEDNSSVIENNEKGVNE